MPFPQVLEFRARLTELAEALHDGRASRPRASIAALNEQLGQIAGPPAAHPGRRRVAASASSPSARSARSRPSPAPPRPPWPSRAPRSAAAPASAARSSSPTTPPTGSRRWCDAGGVRPARPTSSGGGAAAPVTGPEPVEAFERTRAALGDRYRLERIVAANADRVLFEAHDETLKRRVSVRVNFFRDQPSRAWFLREARGARPARPSGHPPRVRCRRGRRPGVPDRQLDRRRGAAGRGRAGAPAASRRCSPWPATCWARWSTPTCRASSSAGSCPPRCWSDSSGRGTITDLRFCSYTLPAVPPGTVARPADVHGARDPGRRASAIPPCDVYTAGALLYFAITGQRPPLDPKRAAPADRASARPAPRAIERIVLRALQPAAGGPLSHRGRDAGGLRLGRRHVRDPGGRRRVQGPRRGTRGQGPLGEVAPPRPGRRLRAARRCSARAGSAGCTACGTCTSSARWRSRCCTRR